MPATYLGVYVHVCMNDVIIYHLNATESSSKPLFHWILAQHMPKQVVWCFELSICLSVEMSKSGMQHWST